ncbi:MAG: NAD+ synthase [Methanotrichaceae archaeon]
MIEEDVKTPLVEFIRRQVKAAESKGAVLGLSGGLDSAVVACLAAQSLGKENVLALLLPEHDLTPKDDLEDARTVARQLGIETKEIDISEILACYSKVLSLESAPKVVSGNLKARIRMTLIYWYANLLHRLVLGTGNKTEIMLGYCTKYGDAAADILPLARLYKDEVRALGKQLGVPNRILEKAPSAGLWPGQTDEAEIGISYQEANEILRGIERGLNPEELKRSYGESQVNLVLEKVEKSKHKRELLPKPDLEQLA